MPEDQDTNAQNSADSGEEPAGTGQSRSQRPVIKLDPANVPPELHFLIPYVEKWGISDKELRETLLRQAELEELEELNRIVKSALNDLVRALNFPPLDEPGSLEASAFADLMMASGAAKSILAEVRWRTQSPNEQTRPQPEPERSERTDSEKQRHDGMTAKQWLEMVGWPDHYPAIKPDPAKVPPELHFLIPYAEKWVLKEDVVQARLIKEATTEELAEFVLAVKQIGIKEIGHVALKMVYDETQHAEGNYLLAMLEAAEDAEYELKKRSHDTPNDEVKSEE